MTVDTRDASLTRQAARQRRRRNRRLVRIAAVGGAVCAAGLASLLATLELAPEKRAAVQPTFYSDGERIAPIPVGTQGEILPREASTASAHAGPTLASTETTSAVSLDSGWELASQQILPGELGTITLPGFSGGSFSGLASSGRAGGGQWAGSGGSGYVPAAGGAGAPRSGVGGFESSQAPQATGRPGVNRGTAARGPSPIAGPGVAPRAVNAPGPLAATPSGGPGAAPASPAPAATPEPLPPIIIADGPVEGFGPIPNTVTVVPGGILAPGASPGELTLLDDFTLFGGILEIDIWGYTPGDEHDLLTIEGAAIFDSGAIQFVFTNDETGEIFAPEVGDTFTFLTADKGIFGFDNNPDLFLLSLDLASGLDFIVTNSNNALTLEIIAASSAASLQEQPPTPEGPTYQVSSGTASSQSALLANAVSAPGTLALQLLGVSLILISVTARRRRGRDSV